MATVSLLQCVVIILDFVFHTYNYHTEIVLQKMWIKNREIHVCTDFFSQIFSGICQC